MFHSSVHDEVLSYLDAAPFLFLSIQPDETIRLANRKASDLLFCPREELNGMNWFDQFIPLEHRAALRDVFQKIISGQMEAEKELECSVLIRNGKKKRMRWSVSVQKDKNGTITGAFFSGEEISAQTLDEAFIHTLSEQTSEVLLTQDSSGSIQYLSPSFYKILGYKKGKVKGRLLIDYIHPAEKEVFSQLLQTLEAQPGQSTCFKLRFMTGDGTYIWTEGEGRNLLHDPGVHGILFNFRNISERILLEERFKLLFELSPDALLLVDDNGVMDCNDACLRMLVCKNKADVVGRSPSSFSPKYQPDGRLSSKKAKEMTEIAMQQNYHSFDWLHKNFSGGVFPVEVSVIPLEKLGKGISLVRWHNIAQRKRFELELIMAKSEAEATSKAQEEFLSTMSHEIRTPLNAVIGMSHILLEENPRKDQIENLKILKFSSENLLSLINDILDYNKIQSGKIKLEQIEFNLPHLVNSICRSLQYKAEEKRLQLKVALDKNLPEFLLGDPTRLGQVLNNLLGNAVKFTGKGSVELSVSLVREHDQEADIRFEIRDTGIGISNEKLVSIFDQFTQGDSATTRKYGGTGLGLSITKRLLHLMGTQILVESKEGEGSVFYYTLRFQKRKRNSGIIKGLQGSESLEHLNLHVLLVEDNEINQMVVSKFIRRWGIEVDIAGHGEIAIEKARNHSYDLILMDLQMPDIDGFTTTRRIRSEGYRGPIVALTAEVLFDVKDKVLKAGMIDIVGKPFKPQDLLQKIKQYCLKEEVMV